LGGLSDRQAAQSSDYEEMPYQRASAANESHEILVGENVLENEKL
jgi:hypothetical protein